MKKKSKIILATLVLIISLILIYIVYQNIKEFITEQEINKELNEVVTAHATGIVVAKTRDKHDNRDTTSITLKEREDSTRMSYRFGIASNTTIKNINGEEIQVSELNLGDKIYITYEDKVMKEMIYTYPKPLYNIKSIEVLEDNSDNHLTEDDLSYNNFELTGIEFRKDRISFLVRSLHTEKFPNDYSSTICKIVKKANDGTKNVEEILSIDPTVISSENEYSSSNYSDGKIKIAVPDLEEELETGEYILRLENEELGLIKIPFKITASGLYW